VTELGKILLAPMCKAKGQHTHFAENNINSLIAPGKYQALINIPEVNSVVN
jgi:hypothetical protein